MSPLREKLQKVLQEKLSSETVLWVGQPSRAAARHDGKMYSLSVLLGLAFMAVFVPILGCRSIETCMQFANSFQGIVWTVYLVGYAVVAIFAPTYASWKSERTLYAVTTRRAIVVRDTWALTVDSYHPWDFEIFDPVVREDGSGKIVFSRIEWGQAEGAGVMEWGFLSLGNVAEAKVALRKLLLSAPKLPKGVAAQLAV